jgi:hypothetical protein
VNVHEVVVLLSAVGHAALAADAGPADNAGRATAEIASITLMPARLAKAGMKDIPAPFLKARD